MRSRIVSIWCLRNPEDARRYEDVISSLTKASSTQAFQPHLTLGSLSQRSDLSGLIKTGFSLAPLELDGNAVFTTSLFVRFKASEPLIRARQTLEQNLSFRPGRVFDPHISLHYGPPPCEATKSKQVSALLDHPVRFDRLAAIEMEVPIEDPSALLTWRTLDTYELDGL